MVSLFKLEGWKVRDNDWLVSVWMLYSVVDRE